LPAAFYTSGGGAEETRDLKRPRVAALDLSDSVYLLDFLFRGEPTIPAPYPEAGPGT